MRTPEQFFASPVTRAPLNGSRQPAELSGWLQTRVVILTRFNLPSPGIESMIRSEDDWLTNRWRLFTTFCLPSVRRQRDGDFSWIVYLDPESPPWLQEQMALLSEEGVLAPVYRTTVPRSALIDDIASVAGMRSGDHLITANLDNDDALAAGFVERIRALPLSHGRTAIYFDHGLIRRGDRVYLRRDRQNAFCAVREPWDRAETCWVDWHNLLHRHMPVEHIGGAPGWLQVIHQQNVSNLTRGRRVAPGGYRGLFPGLIDDVSRPAPHDLMRDRLISGPSRVVRDGGRSTIRHTAVRLLGRDRWEDVRSTVGEAVRRSRAR